MTTIAPLGFLRLEGVHITREHSSVVMVVEETLDLYEWLRGQRQAFNGRAKGNRFRLTIDGVTMDCRRVFVRYKSRSRSVVFLTITSWPGETAAAAFGRKVGKAVYEIKLERTEATRKQGELVAKAAGLKRVTVEELPEPAE